VTMTLAPMASIAEGARVDTVDVVAQHLGLGRIVTLYYTTHPLHTIFPNIIGTSNSEATMRPNPSSTESAATRRRRR
jgi:hypothetical protein